MSGQLSEAKSAAETGANVLGYREKGGIIRRPDGAYGALKHNIHRYNHGSSQPWGRENSAYIEADIVPVGYHLEVPERERTLQATSEWLTFQENGEQPPEATIGVEVEAVSYHGSRPDLVPAHGPLWPLENNQHPELLSHMLETASGRTPGGYPRTPVEIAQAVAEAVNTAEEIAVLQGKRLVYSSVPEGGRAEDAEITPHPYLLAFSPKVLEATLQHQRAIPPEVLDTYRRVGIDIIPYLTKTGVLNWPVNALHVHNGVPQIEGLADPRAGYAMAMVRMTEMAKILSLMLYNTSHCYGADTGLRDVRSVMRRLLATSHDSTMPGNSSEFIRGAVSALEEGQIHSLPRHPWQGQHDRIRIRMDGDKKTMESIDAAMNPDLRLTLAWIFANQIMNTMALDALQTVDGDEAQVLPFLQAQYGPLMREIPALGSRSSYAHDLLFNRDGYGASIPWREGKTYRSLLAETNMILRSVAAAYPALRIQAAIVGHIISQQTAGNGQYGLTGYMGIERGVYQPNGKNIGLLTDAKNGSLEEIIAIQDAGTKLQAQSLAAVTEDRDLLAWLGL